MRLAQGGATIACCPQCEGKLIHGTSLHGVYWQECLACGWEMRAGCWEGLCEATRQLRESTGNR